MGQASQRDARNARIPVAVSDQIEICQAIDGQWYWHRRSSNGGIVADSGQRYHRKWNARRAANREARPLGLDVIVVG